MRCRARGSIFGAENFPLQSSRRKFIYVASQCQCTRTGELADAMPLLRPIGPDDSGTASMARRDFTICIEARQRRVSAEPATIFR